MRRSGVSFATVTNRGAVELLADVCVVLARAPADIESILVLATSRLSRLRPATWVAVVMNPNPETCRIVVADDRDREKARYVEDYVAAIDRPKRVPTVGMSQQVIATGKPIVVPRISFDEYLLLLSPEGQAFCRTNPPPGKVSSVGFLIVPMRVGGATLGTLGVFDSHDRHTIDESDVEWIQMVADRIGLSVEHARLTGGALVHAAEMDLVQAVALSNAQGPEARLTLGSVVERVAALPEVDAADIMLVTEDGKELTVAASAGYRSPWPAEHRVDARWATMELKPFRYRPDLELKGNHPRRAQFVREGFETFGSVPLRSPNRTIGVLNLYSRAMVEWEPMRFQFLDSLGALVAMALDRPARPAQAVAAGTAHRPDFSDLELHILRLIAEGHTNREIAAQVYRSENTVKFHVRRILEKSNAANRTELVRHAFREGWL